VASNDSLEPNRPSQDSVTDEDMRLVQQIREGDSAAGHRFVQQHYPGVYHYLLYLSGRPELAEDLTQETFLQAWSRLDTFAGRAPLRLWLHRIAHRMFLQAVRRPRSVVPLDEAVESDPLSCPNWSESMVLRAAIAQLPVEHRQVVVLHYLQGYSCREIGQIIQAPVGTVKYWLSLARAHLQRELGEGDLAYLNEGLAPMRQWAWLPMNQVYALEARLSARGAGHASTSAGNRAASKEERMDRREFCRHVAAATAGLLLPESEKNIVDDRLTQKVTLAVKATALADLCEHLRAESSVNLAAGPSVADEKVTVFCQKLPLRDVMRQLSRPFGYAWLRTSKAGEYRYELVQDLRSQLLEEELRNRDVNAALLALDAEMQQYRPYLDMSFGELQTLWGQGGETAKLLTHMVHNGGWGGIQLYHHLTPRDRTALVAGEELTFRPDASDSDRRLPTAWTHPLLQALSHRSDAQGELTPVKIDASSGPTLLSDAPGIRVVQVRLKLNRSELGQLSLILMIVTSFKGAQGEQLGFNLRELATRRTPLLIDPDNVTANAALRAQAPFDRVVTVRPNSSCLPGKNAGQSDHDPRFDRIGEMTSTHVTSADVWEAIHRATGLPIVADYYTRLYPLDEVTVRDQPLFEALCRVGDALGARWRKDGAFLVCRSTSYFWDKLKEVPNRYLQQWARNRDASGGLPFGDFLQMASMADQQLDSTLVAEGIEHCWDLREWAWLSGASLEGRLQRQHARFLATLTSDQRRRALEPSGLSFAGLTPAQQQGMIRLQYEILEALEREEGTSPSFQPEELASARITTTYIPAGWYIASVQQPPATEQPRSGRVIQVGGRTPDEARAEARRLFPGSVPQEVRRLRDGYFRADIELRNA
jgi:RNA polymerase sigma-70 factor, ECF subfamily